jgi:hypothetical protein
LKVVLTRKVVFRRGADKPPEVAKLPVLELSPFFAYPIDTARFRRDEVRAKYGVLPEVVSVRRPRRIALFARPWGDSYQPGRHKKRDVPVYLPSGGLQLERKGTLRGVTPEGAIEGYQLGV